MERAVDAAPLGLAVVRSQPTAAERMANKVSDLSTFLSEPNFCHTGVRACES